MMAVTYTLTPNKGGTKHHLSQAQMDRFFDNRNPADWDIRTNPCPVCSSGWARLIGFPQGCTCGSFGVDE